MGAGQFSCGAGSSAGLDPAPTATTTPPAANEVYYDPAVRAWLIANGALAEMHWVDQSMALCLTISKGAIRSLPDLGIDRARLRKVTRAKAQAAVEAVVGEAIAHLTSKELVTVLGIDVEYAPGELGFRVRYQNNLLPPGTPPSVVPPNG